MSRTSPKGYRTTHKWYLCPWWVLTELVLESSFLWWPLGRKALLFIILQNESLIWLFSDAVYLFSCNSFLGDQSMERICIWSLCSTPKGCSHNQVLGSAVCHFKSNQTWMSAGALISVKSWFSAILQGYFTKIKRITIHKIRADFIRINKPSVEFSEWNWRHGNHLLELLTGRKLISVYLYSREQSQMPDRLGTLATYIIAQLIFFLFNEYNVQGKCRDL